MSRRALEVLALVVLALAAAQLLVPRRTELRPSTRVFPARARQVTLARPGAAPVQVDLDAGTVDRAAADPDALRDLAGALEILSTRRRVPSADPGTRGLAAPRLTVTVDDLTLRVGDAVPDLGQVWVTAGAGWDGLVDAGAVRELDRSAIDLRRRAVFTFIASEVTSITLERGAQRVAITGRPPCVELAGGCARAARDRVRALLDALADLRLDRFAATPAGEPSLRVTAGGETLSVHGACGEDRVAVVSPAGAGCLRTATLPELDTDPMAWVETRVLSLPPAEIDHLEIGGATFDRRGGVWDRGGAAVSPDAVRELLDELASHRGRPAPAPALAQPPPGAAVLRVAAGATAETLWLTPDLHVQRAGEPVALAVDPATRSAFQLDPELLADRRVLVFDASALRRIQAEPPVEIAIRGETGESWSLAAPAAMAADRDAVAALRDAAASLTARRVVRQGAGFPGRRLTLATDDAPGVPAALYTLELGGPAAGGGCYARAGGPAIYVLSDKACAALAAPLATREVFAGEVTAVTWQGRRATRHGARWFAAGGAPLPDPEAQKLGALVESLRRAPAVAGYGTQRDGGELTVETDAGTVTLRVGVKTYGRTDRPVLYARP